MPRHAWMNWALILGAAVSAARAQDDLGPPPKAPGKKATAPLPPDDIFDPPAPKRSSTASQTPVKDTVQFPGVALPDTATPLQPKAEGEAPRASVSKPPAAPTSLELPSPPSVLKATDQSDLKSAPRRVALPSAPATDQGMERQTSSPPTVASRPEEKALTAATVAAPVPTPTIKISGPVTAQSTRPRKAATAPATDAVPQPKREETVIPAPESAGRVKHEGPIAASESRDARRERRKASEHQKKAAEKAPLEQPVVQASASFPAPKPQDRYELVQPRVPTYDVVHARNSIRADADSVATVYETFNQLVAGAPDGIVQVGATTTDDPRSTVESYAVKIWKIDGWETFTELARMEYRDDALATTLAKYNRSGRRPSDPLPAGQKVRLPPKWVLERSGTTVARRPAPIKTDFTGPPATSVEGQAMGSGVVASSGRSKTGGLVKSNDASPLPSERTPVPDDGKVFVVNEQGMTLYKVAKKVLGKGQDWQRIYELNRDRLSSSQAELKVGTRLRLPEDSMIR